MQIGYVGVGVRRASLFVRSPASLSLLWVRCICDLVGCRGWEEGQVREVGSKAAEDLQTLSSHLGLANVGNRSCRLNNFQMS